MKKNILAFTFTGISKITANYGENQGNISSIQKIYKNGRAYPMRSSESLKYTIFNLAGFYDNLKIDTSTKVATKEVSDEINLRNTPNLEGGYMSVGKQTKIRKSSIRITDAISQTPFNGTTQFHNNLALANKYAKDNNLNLQEKASECGLMPYEFEFDDNLKVFSVTVLFDIFGEDENFDIHLSKEEKKERLLLIVNAIKNLTFEVKGNLDNAEPLFAIGGLSDRATHVFENMIKLEDNKVLISEELKIRSEDYHVGVRSDIFDNSNEIKTELNATSIDEFFEIIKSEIEEYYQD